MEYTNKQLLLNKRPTGMPEDDCWKINEEKITSLKKLGVKNYKEINNIIINKFLNTFL